MRGKRHGQINERDGLVPRDHWHESWEREAMLAFHAERPGFQRCATGGWPGSNPSRAGGCNRRRGQVGWIGLSVWSFAELFDVVMNPASQSYSRLYRRRTAADGRLSGQAASLMIAFLAAPTLGRTPAHLDSG
jgi:hypothetical protein